jgi:hypothetical protein
LTSGLFDIEFWYSFMALEFRGATSKTYTYNHTDQFQLLALDHLDLTGIPRLSLRPVHCGYYQKLSASIIRLGLK